MRRVRHVRARAGAPRERVRPCPYARPRRQDLWRDERGDTIMLEAMIVYPLTWFLLFFILATFMVFYEGWHMQVIANEAASLIGETAKFTSASSSRYPSEIKNGVNLSEDDLSQLKSMRTSVSRKESVRIAGNTAQIEKRIEAYVQDRLPMGSLATPIDGWDVEVEVPADDGLGRAHVEVTISGDFYVLFGDVLPLFGLEPSIHMSRTAYAQLLDLSDYLQGTQTVFGARDMGINLGVTDKLGSIANKAEGIGA